MRGLFHDKSRKTLIWPYKLISKKLTRTHNSVFAEFRVCCRLLCMGHSSALELTLVDSAQWHRQTRDDFRLDETSPLRKRPSQIFQGSIPRNFERESCEAKQSSPDFPNNDLVMCDVDSMREVFHSNAWKTCYRHPVSGSNYRCRFFERDEETATNSAHRQPLF